MINNLKFQKLLDTAKWSVFTPENERQYSHIVVDPYDGKTYTFYIHHDHEELSKLRALKEKYTKDFGKHLEEAFDSSSYFYDQLMECDLIDIDLDTTYQCYKFGIHELLPKGTLENYTHEIVLSEDQYTELVALHLYDKHLSINLLRYYDRELYDIIINDVDAFNRSNGYYLIFENPYIITLDDAKDLAEHIVSECNLFRREISHENA